MKHCRLCNSNDVIKTSKNKNSGDIYFCNNCNKCFNIFEDKINIISFKIKK